MRLYDTRYVPTDDMRPLAVFSSDRDEWLFKQRFGHQIILDKPSWHAPD